MSYSPVPPVGQDDMAGSLPVVIASDQNDIKITLDGETVAVASSALPTGASTSALQSTGNTSLATIAGAVAGTEMQVDVLTLPNVTIGAAIPAGTNNIGDVDVLTLPVAFNTGTVSATTQRVTPATDVTTPILNTVSTANSSTAVLAGAAVFTGTSEDVRDYSLITINVIASHASTTDGLSIQQSSNGTNWDITDTYTIAATTGRTFSVPRQAQYFRLVYTNGATLQTSFRLQTIFSRISGKSSSQRASDAYTNETDLEQMQTFLMGYNGTTWDRLRSDTTNGLDVDVTRAFVQGDIAHDSADSGNPQKIGGVAVSGSATPTSVASGDRTRFIANQHGIPYSINGHPNLITREYDFGSAAQTDVNLAAAVVAADERVYVTRFEVMCDNANSGNVSARAGFGTANVPAASATGVSGMIGSHPNIAPGSGFMCGNGSGIIAVGGAGEEPRITTSAASANTHVVISYFLIDETP